MWDSTHASCPNGASGLAANTKARHRGLQSAMTGKLQGAVRGNRVHKEETA